MMSKPAAHGCSFSRVSESQDEAKVRFEKGRGPRSEVALSAAMLCDSAIGFYETFQLDGAEPYWSPYPACT